MRCIRCAVPMQEIRALGGQGGAYREAWRIIWGCPKCGGRLLERHESDDLAGALAHSMLVREEKRTDLFCPGCKDRMLELSLSWGGHWLMLEECPGCQRVFVDRGELEKATAWLKQAAALQSVDLSKLDDSPTDGAPQDITNDPIVRFVDQLRDLLDELMAS